MCQPPLIVSILIRGFANPYEQIVKFLGKQPDRVGKKGSIVRPGFPAILSQDFIRYDFNYSDSEPWDSAVSNAISQLGGAELIQELNSAFKPNSIELDLVISREQEYHQVGTFFSKELVRDIQLLGASVSFSFVEPSTIQPK